MGSASRINQRVILEMVELAYRPADRHALITGLLPLLKGLFPGARNTGFFEFRIHEVPGGISFLPTEPLIVLGDSYGIDALPRLSEQPAALLATMFAKTMATTMSSASGAGSAIAQWPFFRAMWRPPVHDSLGLVSREPGGRGFLLYTGLPETTTLRAREQGLLTKLVVHLAAGLRLRDQTGPEAAEAVLTPNGKILHALEEAQGEREALDDGRRRQAFARKNPDDPQKALEVWRGLIAGRWSLVDHFDTDGKRFLLAMKNPPPVDRRGELSPHELRVGALASLGHRDKEIAYMLGLSLGAVSSSLHRARRKLGVRSRAELAKVWRAKAPHPAPGV
jgi:DNA-binding CsgD family transcriptional regulator